MNNARKQTVVTNAPSREMQANLIRERINVISEALRHATQREQNATASLIWAVETYATIAKIQPDMKAEFFDSISLYGANRIEAQENKQALSEELEALDAELFNTVNQYEAAAVAF